MIKNDPNYLKINKEGAFINEKFTLQLRELQENYATSLTELDKQYQQNLLSIPKGSQQEVNASLRLSEMNRQKSLFEEMLQVQRKTLAQNYAQNKVQLATALKEALTAWNIRLNLQLAKMRKVQETEGYKQPLQLAMDKLQQELQQSKAAVEKEYLDSRAVCQEKFELLKKNIAKKSHTESSILVEKHQTVEKYLIRVHDSYQTSIFEANEFLNICYNELAEVLEAKKNKLQTLVDLELVQLNELFFNSNNTLLLNWIDTLGGTAEDWAIFQSLI
jgi:hypothetical protein